MRWLGTLVYWIAVLAVSLVLVVLLILFLESRDAAEVDAGAGRPSTAALDAFER